MKQRWNKVQIWSRIFNGSVKVTYSLYSLDFTDKKNAPIPDIKNVKRVSSSRDIVWGLVAQFICPLGLPSL